MNVRKYNRILVVTNPLGLILCNICENETVYFQPVTRLEQEYVNWVEAGYDRLIDCVIEE